MFTACLQVELGKVLFGKLGQDSWRNNKGKVMNGVIIRLVLNFQLSV